MIVLITPTGSRYDQIMLCAHYMKRQTYEGKVLWLIVDDGVKRTTDSITTEFKCNWEIVKLYLTPSWRPGQNTQARNLYTATEHLRLNYSEDDIEGIFIIEDDDYYKANYLEEMMKRFGDYDIIGEKNTVYYNVKWRNYYRHPNTTHASLFQTAFSIKALSLFEQSLGVKFIDCLFWEKGVNKHLFNAGDLAVGMKGIPGRAGIGMGHNRNSGMTNDLALHKLRELIGDDCEFYASYGNFSPHRNSFFDKRYK